MKEHCDIGVEPNEQQQKRRRGPKVDAGKRIVDLLQKRSSPVASSSKKPIQNQWKRKKSTDNWVCTIMS